MSEAWAMAVTNELWVITLTGLHVLNPNLWVAAIPSSTTKKIGFAAKYDPHSFDVDSAAYQIAACIQNQLEELNAVRACCTKFDYACDASTFYIHVMVAVQPGHMLQPMNEVKVFT